MSMSLKGQLHMYVHAVRPFHTGAAATFAGKAPLILAALYRCLSSAFRC